MSKFDPPAPRFNPQPPSPVHEQKVHVDDEIPPIDPNVANQVTIEGCNNANLMRAVALGLRGLSMVFSFLCFVIIATIKDFNQDNTSNYVFSVALISFIYNVFQNGKAVFVLVTGKESLSNCDRLSALIDFIGDQVMTYLLVSASSGGFVLLNDTRQLIKILGIVKTSALNTVLSKTAGASSMLFFAFLALLFPTLFSGHKLFRAFTCSSK